MFSLKAQQLILCDDYVRYARDLDVLVKKEITQKSIQVIKKYWL